MKSDINYIEEFKSRTKEIVEAIETLSKHYTVELSCVTPHGTMHRDYQEINLYVDAYLREWCKNNPYVNIK